ncbi:hypothetical protein BU24DRAFT_490055 [Aaosphaeria arxii CBS 175.79]|uniref:Uncharacterized protein n=1 Tax=Aaosphaeria arxii CBS 175.79 TaxID=1450172 RepID=A0A6A5Y447_9PLEO|nr:uncharacterized protein BU24DRAFT_490055 [Aaosphaeria arxii CBS 175.79]KAF2020268.1 hypothetical protein BU24DRAFT_490055 [Aaosphaeria arxii CBS 175.79]
MVSTRRKANLNSVEPEADQPPPTPKPRRPTRARATAAQAATASGPSTAPAPAPAPARQSKRLRGDDSASPLQSLQSEKKPKKRAAASTSATPLHKASKNANRQVEQDEIEESVFFKIENQQLRELVGELNIIIGLQKDEIDFLHADRRRFDYEIESLRSENARFRKEREPLSSGDELLRRIENRKYQNDMGVQTDVSETMDIDGPHVITEPTTPAQASQSPIQSLLSPAPLETTGWGLRSLFGRVASVFRSPAPAPAIIVPPATAPPKPLSSEEVKELTDSLGVNDTPTRAPAKRAARPKRTTQRDGTASTAPGAQADNNTAAETPRNQRTMKPKAQTVHKSVPDRKSIISRVTQGIQDDMEKNAAMDWAKTHAAMLAKDVANLGDKRKRLDEQWKVEDLAEIPACKPWQTGSFGLLDEFWDDSDEEHDVPEWAKLAELTKEQPPKKKRKTTSSSPIIMDTQGHSSSLSDLHPRPSTTPSPMFENPTSHSSNANVFDEHKVPEKEDDNKRFSHFFEGTSFKPKELPPSISFDTPKKPAAAQETEEHAWTQPPPPPPAPAHASLPVPLTSAPSVPAMPATQSGIFASTESIEDLHDPVKTQRLQALKHTPAKASRLREMMIPSPSLKSDGGSPLGPLSSPTPNGFSAVPVTTSTTTYDIPDAIPLDLGSPELLEEAQRLFDSEEYKAATANAYGGAEVYLTYESDEEAPSSSDLDFDEEL